MPSQMQVDSKCAQCGIRETAHRDLYSTPLGILTFSFQPDEGSLIEGQVRLCRPCTHEILSRRILHAAGVPSEALVAEIWK